MHSTNASLGETSRIRPAAGLSAAFRSPRMNEVKASPASILRRRARDLRKAGRHVIELSTGDLDFPTPDHVIAAAHAAALRGETHYAAADGTPALKDAIRAAFRRHNGLIYAEDEVIVTTGSIQALCNALLATLAPGDEVVIPTPCWAPYLDQVRLAEGTPVLVACPQFESFKLRPEQLRAAITARTRWLILNNPTNPTGAVYAPDELAALAAVLMDFPDVWVLTDILYEHIVFDGRRAHSIAEIEPRLAARTLTVSGLAKAYAMEGWRVGYAAGPTMLIAAMATLQSLTTSCASTISQAAAVAALLGPQDLLRDRVAVLSAKRDAFAALLNACEGLSCPLSEGTFYLFVSCAGVIGKRTPGGQRIGTDREFAAYLLDSADVVVLPGEDCGFSPAFRVSVANPRETIEEAGRRIKQACAALQ
jgi:aspartate aminotransferase